MIQVQVDFERSRFRLTAETRFAERVTGLFGPSGAGKSTLLHSLAGLITPDSGRIVVDDVVFFDRAQRINLPPHRRRCGVVFQDARLFPHRTVRANLEYGMPDSDRWIEFDEVVELFEIGALLDARPTELSGGEMQRVAMGRALLTQPRLLLLDEPLSGLDGRRKRQVLPFLRRLRDRVDIPIVYVTHDLRELLYLTDQLCLVEGGRILGTGSYRDLAQQTTALDLLLATGLANVHEWRVVEHRPREGYTALSNDDGDGALQLLAPHTDLPLGSSAWSLTRPEDFAVAAEAVPGISVQNQFWARVRRSTDFEGRVVIEVETETDPSALFLVEVSTGSRDRLGVRVGQRVNCLLKTNAIEVQPR